MKTKRFLLSLIIVLSGCATSSVEQPEETTVKQHVFDPLEYTREPEPLVSGPFYSDKDIDCLSRNIYYESGSEPFEGKVAVAQVTMNRVQDGRFGDSVCGVIYQKNVFYEKVICQFSWVCETTHKTRPVYPPLWAESEIVAKKVLLENFRLPGLKSALYYHADYVSPGWKKPKIDKIGRHIFYGA